VCTLLGRSEDNYKYTPNCSSNQTSWVLLKCIRDKWRLQGLFSDASVCSTLLEQNSESSVSAVIQTPVMSKWNWASVTCYVCSCHFVMICLILDGYLPHHSSITYIRWTPVSPQLDALYLVSVCRCHKLGQHLLYRSEITLCYIDTCRIVDRWFHCYKLIQQNKISNFLTF